MRKETAARNRATRTAAPQSDNGPGQYTPEPAQRKRPPPEPTPETAAAHEQTDEEDCTRRPNELASANENGRPARKETGRPPNWNSSTGHCNERPRPGETAGAATARRRIRLPNRHRISSCPIRPSRRYGPNGRRPAHR